MRRCVWLLSAAVGVVTTTGVSAQQPTSPPQTFHVEEATIADIHRAIEARELTATRLVQLYLARIKAYNGTCVNQPDGILGKISTIRNAGQINALMTLNLRLATRKTWGFDDRKARSMTDTRDDQTDMPDALEVAAELDRTFTQTGKLVGPLHGVVIALKDQYNTFDMRTTAGADAFYANDRPPRDAVIVKRLRDAGAIILAKANMGEYAAGDRSSFGGTECNPYDTERSPGGSSGGSASSVSANLVTCAIGEEGGPSIRMPSRFNNIVGISPSQGLVSRDGMLGGALSDRVGPMCRTVADTARVLDVIAGYDPADELTVFSVRRQPSESYFAAATTNTRSLAGVRIGVLREYMNKELFTQADFESIDIVDRAVRDLQKLGASIVDPGPTGALFQDCIDKYVPHASNALFTGQVGHLFPRDANGNPTTDHIPRLVDLFANPLKEGNRPTMRGFGPAIDNGEGKYRINRYLKERGDSNIKTLDDLITKARFFSDVRPGGPGGGDSRFPDRKSVLETMNRARTVDMRERMASRFAVQQVVMQCMSVLNIDAVVYPTGNVPPPILVAPTEPTKNGRDYKGWAFLGQQGFPAMTVPAGFTSHVFDRVRDDSSADHMRMVGPVAAKLPVGIDFLGRPFDEAMLFRIASAYEAATRHRTPPPSFGPLVGGSR
jgi:Asp-tRNA(Asn)/Glu-tRNA(Gln) amidotransferase A subunit family amidase